MDERFTRWLLVVGGVIAVLLLVIVILLLADDGGGGEAATTTAVGTTVADTTTIPATTATTAASTTQATTTTPATDTFAQGRCVGTPSADFPADAADVTQGPGNFDGEPEPESIMEADQAIVFSSGGSWWVALMLWPDGVVMTELPEPVGEGGGFVPALHSVQSFGDADDGALVHIDRSGASGADVYAFYFLGQDCAVEDAGTVETDRLEFLHGFGAAHREGLTCAGDGVYETSAGAGDGGLWDVRSRFYEWDPEGEGFLFVFEDGMEVPEDDPEALAAGDLDC
jgi:hypothetical protein